MSRLEGGFSIIALLDGTTINGVLRVEGAPLVQRYKTGTSTFIPDLSPITSPDLLPADRPTAVILVRNLSTGGIMTPVDYTFSYNGVTMTFVDVTSGSFEGKKMCSNILGGDGEYLFELISDYPLTVGSTTYYLPAIRVWGNLVPISSANNDLITASGHVELNGQQIQFMDLSQTVVIQEDSGSAYDVIITDNMGGVLTDDSQTLTATCEIYKDGSKVTTFSGYTFKWYKILGTGEEAWGTNRTQDVVVSDIDSLLKLRCDVYYDNSYVVSGNHQVADNTDEYYMDFNITGITGNSIRLGETAVITPVMRKRSDGTAVTKISTWAWTILKNDGSTYKTHEGTSLELTYTEVMVCGGGVSGSVSGTW